MSTWTDLGYLPGYGKTFLIPFLLLVDGKLLLVHRVSSGSTAGNDAAREKDEENKNQHRSNEVSEAHGVQNTLDHPVDSLEAELLASHIVNPPRQQEDGKVSEKTQMGTQ